MKLEYTDLALEDLRGIPLRHADQIMRKVERLRSRLDWRYQGSHQR